jgi:hypothetical protein
LLLGQREKWKDNGGKQELQSIAEKLPEWDF